MKKSSPKLTRRGLVDSYDKARADTYEARTSHKRLWAAEAAYMMDVVGRLRSGSSILDIPVGTGRFLSAYDQRGLAVTGMDTSAHMLAKAREKLSTATLRLGNIFKIPAPDASFDTVAAIRIMHLIGHDDFEAAFGELKRVARERIVMTLELGSGAGECSGLERKIRFTRTLGEWKVGDCERLVRDWYIFELVRR